VFAISIYNYGAMKIFCVALLCVLGCLAACNKSAAPSTPSNSSPAPEAKSPDAVQQKLQESSGAGATDCGRLDAHAAEAQLKTASDCALQAAQGKHSFYVAYDMPGMTVGVAGNDEGKLFVVQAQGAAGAQEVAGGPCPAQLRVASSGRVTCYAPGDMGSMSPSHAAGSMPPGMANPHGTGMTNPHAEASTPK